MIVIKVEDHASASILGVAVSTAPFNLAIRPTLDRFRSRTAAASSSGDLRHQAPARACRAFYQDAYIRQPVDLQDPPGKAWPQGDPVTAESATFCPIGKKYQTLIGVCSKLCVDNRGFDSQLCAKRDLACSQLCVTSASCSVNDRGQCSQVCVNSSMRHEVANSAQCDSPLSPKQVSSGGLHSRD